MAVDKQVMIIYAGNTGYLDEIPIEKVPEFEREFLQFMETKYPDVAWTSRTRGS